MTNEQHKLMKYLIKFIWGDTNSSLDEKSKNFFKKVVDKIKEWW